MNKINKLALISYVMGLTGCDKMTTENGIYLLSKGNGLPVFQIEFVPACAKYFFTIYIRSIDPCDNRQTADSLHNDIRRFLYALTLNKKLSLETETIGSFLKN